MSTIRYYLLLLFFAVFSRDASSQKVTVSVVGSGAVVAGGGGVTISGTIGQPVIGLAAGNISAGFGFWYARDGRRTPAGTNDMPSYSSLFSVQQPYPHPVSSSSSFQVFVPGRGSLSIRIFDVFGRLALTLTQNCDVTGLYHIPLDAAGLRNGQYFVTAELNNERKTGSFFVVK